MSSPQHDPDLEPHSESNHQPASETSSGFQPVPQPDSPIPKDMLALLNLPPRAITKVNDEDVTMGHEEAALQETDSQNNGASAGPQTHSPAPGASQASHPSLQDLAGGVSSTAPAQTLQTQFSPGTIQEDIGKSSNASTAPSEDEDFMEITPPPCEVIDLTDDGPYNGPSLAPEDRALKQEADDSMVPAEPLTIPKQPQADAVPTIVDLDPMDMDEATEDTYALPVLESGDDSWQFSAEDRAQETENAMLMISAAAHTFRSSLPTNPPSSKNPTPAANDFESSGPIDIDSEAEDAVAIVEFEEMKERYLREKKAGELDISDEIEFNRAEQAESDRKRRRVRNNARHASPQQDDQSMFIPDDGRRSPSPAPQAADEEMNLLMRYESPEPAQIPPAGKSDKKGKGRPKGSKTTANGGIRKNTGKARRAKQLGRDGKPLMSNSVNVGSLLNNDLIAIAQQNQRMESQPTFTSKRKGKALTELISSMPKEQQKLYQVDKRELELASKKFAGRGSMRSDGAGGWKLKGMKSSLHHYQLLGAAFMRDLESRSNKPFGGFVSDDMGLGKTVMAICNILDGRPSVTSKAKATLVVAPSSLLTQWMDEIAKHVEPHKLGRILLFRSGSRLVANDMEAALSIEGVVITSYHEVLRSFPKNDPPPQLCTERAKAEWWAREQETNIGPLHRVQWRRVILDEAQAIKNYQSRTSEAVCHLKSKYRWALSGTPIQNKLEEFYAFFRFLDLPHTGSHETFRTNFCKRDSELSIKRLRQYLDQFMLRRTHADQLFGRPILKLKDLKSKTILVEFNTVERAIYKIVRERFVQRIKVFVRDGAVERKYQNIFTLLLRLRQLTCHCFLVQNTFKDLLEEADLQRLWKLTENESDPGHQKMIQGLRFALGNATADTPQPPSELATGGPITYRFRRYLQSMRDDGKWAEIIDKTMCTACKEPPTNPHITGCNHIYCYACLNQLSWNAAMDGDKQGSQCLECGAHFDRTEPCSREDLMTPDRDSPVSVRSGMPKGAATDADGSTDWLTIGGPILQSAKSRAATLQIEQWRLEDPNAKIILFTQFRGMIRVMKRICDERKWGCTPFHGSMTFEARDKAVKSFTNDPKCFVMLCGLKAGGVGLNLTAANRVIIIDLWWNQFVETQAFCRIYRIGQARDVEMVRFVVKDSVDEDIISMQERKNEEIDKAIDSKYRPGRLTARELLQLFAVDLERDEDGDPIAGPNEEPFILTEDPYHESSYIEDNSD